MTRLSLLDWDCSTCWPIVGALLRKTFRTRFRGNCCPATNSEGFVSGLETDENDRWVEFCEDAADTGVVGDAVLPILGRGSIDSRWPRLDLLTVGRVSTSEVLLS